MDILKNIEFIFKIRNIDTFNHSNKTLSNFPNYHFWESDKLDIYYPLIGNYSLNNYGKRIIKFLTENCNKRTILILDTDDEKVLNIVKSELNIQYKIEYFISQFFKIDFSLVYKNEDEIPKIEKDGFSVYKNIESMPIPIIKTSDPITKLLGAKVGDVIKFTILMTDNYGVNKVIKYRCVGMNKIKKDNKQIEEVIEIMDENEDIDGIEESSELSEENIDEENEYDEDIISDEEEFTSEGNSSDDFD